MENIFDDTDISFVNDIFNYIGTHCDFDAEKFNVVFRCDKRNGITSGYVQTLDDKECD